MRERIVAAVERFAETGMGMFGGSAGKSKRSIDSVSGSGESSLPEGRLELFWSYGSAPEQAHTSPKESSPMLISTKGLLPCTWHGNGEFTNIGCV